MSTSVAPALAAVTELRTLSGMNHGLLSRNLDGVTDALATTAPGAGNPIAWSLGHVVYWRQAMLKMLGAAPVWAEGEASGFQGTSRDLPARVDKPWAAVLEAYETSHARLAEALGAVDALPADLARGLAQLLCHETYHIGQIALARRVVGLPGAI
ncbi:MAG: DinB family protein [Vicinamibacterales bacterium]